MGNKIDWTVRELADKVGVNESYIRQLLGSRRLTGYKRAGAWFIPADEAARWVEEKRRDLEVQLARLRSFGK